MYVLKLDGAACICCGICDDSCPTDSIGMRVYTNGTVEGALLFATVRAQARTFPFLAHPSLCDGCMLCVRECPADAITISADIRPATQDLLKSENLIRFRSAEPAGPGFSPTTHGAGVLSTRRVC